MLAVAGAGALWLAGCGKQAPPAFAPPEVTVAQPERRDVRMSVVFTGFTRAIESAEIRARVSGTLMSQHFEPSRMVEEGQLLFVIEQEEYRARRDEARANVAAARAVLARTESDLVRIQKAIATKAVSEQDLDKAQAERDQAEATVMGAQAQLAKAELDYSYTEVRSPIAGQVGRRLIDPGNLVGQGEPTLLTTVNKMDPIFVYWNAPEPIVLLMLQMKREAIERGEEDARETRSGDMEGEPNVLLSLANETDYPHPAWVDYIDNTVDPNTGTIQIRAIVPNESGVLFPGLFVRVKAFGARMPDQVLVDERAIGTDLGGKYVYVLGEQNVVEQVYVQLGETQPDGMVVVREGLTGDETYITNGILRARPGLPVTPLTADEMAARAAAAQEGR